MRRSTVLSLPIMLDFIKYETAAFRETREKIEPSRNVLGRRNVAKHRTDGSVEAGSLLARLQVRAAATGHC
jgi:hypothetical protein